MQLVDVLIVVVLPWFVGVVVADDDEVGDDSSFIWLDWPSALVKLGESSLIGGVGIPWIRV